MASFKSTSLIILVSLLLHLSQINGHGGGNGDASASTTDGGNLRSKGLILVKVWCLIILFVSTFASGISPYFYIWNESFLLLGTQFAGGVFLGTALMHLLSDATSTFGDLTSKTFPFSYMLAASGYLLTMLGDCVIAYVVNGADHHGREARVEVEGVEEGGKEVAVLAVNPVFAKTSSIGDTILLILALCFHSIF